MIRKKMENFRKNKTSITLDNDVLELVQLNRLYDKNFRLSILVNKLVREKLNSQENIDIEIEKTRNLLKSLEIKKIKMLTVEEKLKLENEKYMQNAYSLLTSEKNKDFWIETINILNDDPSMLDGRKKAFNYLFQENFNILEFKGILKYAKSLYGDKYGNNKQ